MTGISVAIALVLYLSGRRARKPQSEPSSWERFVAASTASISEARRRPCSSACRPAMVVPPGEATLSFSLPGCSPVSRTIRAAPSTVCAARARAASRGNPIFTPPVGERFDDQKDVGRPAPAETGHGIHEALVNQHDFADRLEDRAGQPLVLARDVPAQGNRRDPGLDFGRSVRHAADDPDTR